MTVSTVTFIHNPDSGDKDHSATALVARLEGAGFEVEARSTGDPGWRAALVDSGDAVVVAGGDGTVGGVLLAMVGRPEPVYLLPAGTANNIARSLGLEASAEDLAGALGEAVPASLDVGVVHSPDGSSIDFIESTGAGLVTHAIRSERPSPDPAPEEGGTDPDRRRLADFLGRAVATSYRVSADGVDRSGEYLLVEIMNLPRIGPNLTLAPDADHTDGRLDLVLVKEEDRTALACLVADEGRWPPPEVVWKVKEVEIGPSEGAWHLDDQPWAPPGGEGFAVAVRPGAVCLLLPPESFAARPGGR